MDFLSWGRYPKVMQRVEDLEWRHEINLAAIQGSILAYGQGRSYGDCCLNAGGSILSTRFLNRFLSFDTQNGVVRCEAGVTLEDLIAVALPRGWFLPVSPGTKFVSLGGAVANDIHGKNHHSAGTFGRHVRCFELLRSDGSRLLCSPGENQNLFHATIGGIGLTGLITWVEVQLKKVEGPFINVESIQFGSLDEFFDISRESDRDFEYTVAWLDCVATGKNFGRGVFMRGNHAPAIEKKLKGRLLLSVPFNFPGFALNKLSVSAFNTLYFHKQLQKKVSGVVSYDSFFYPLDSVKNWNRIYGARGFVQFQCVVEATANNKAIREILKTVVDQGKASFLAVLKEFGSIPSPGWMSFPRKGVTLCLDFAFEGEKTLRLMSTLEKLVLDGGGALYPAKDACMSAESFRRCYPAMEAFTQTLDPKFSSSFWRRVTEK